MNAVVLLSGGADSAICAAWAKERFGDIQCLVFDYSQSHKKEISSAEKIAEILDVEITEINIPLTSQSSLTGGAGSRNDLPSTFLPCRNLIFLSLAASFAIENNCSNLVTGVCQTDYSGYPDCRQVFIDSIESSIQLANTPLFDDFKIHTPLMNLSKAESVKFAKNIPLAWDCLSESWTCYEGGETPCGTCPACELRMKGFSEVGMIDPALNN